LAVSVKNQIRRLREQQGLSQEQLGDALGVSRQTVNSIENSRYDPSLPLAFKIARHFKLRIEDIFANGK
jgi:putative transcriptional regulator